MCSECVQTCQSCPLAITSLRTHVSGRSEQDLQYIKMLLNALNVALPVLYNVLY